MVTIPPETFRYTVILHLIHPIIVEVEDGMFQRATTRVFKMVSQPKRIDDTMQFHDETNLHIFPMANIAYIEIIDTMPEND